MIMPISPKRATIKKTLILISCTLARITINKRISSLKNPAIGENRITLSENKLSKKFIKFSTSEKIKKD